MIWHLTPVDDQRPHVNESTCECNPNSQILENGDILCVHNSWDGREIFERMVESAKDNKN